MSEEQLEELRQEIDRINLQILDLLNRRARVVEQIGKVKSEKGLEAFSPVRESRMLARILEHNQGPFDDETIKRLFKEIFQASRNLIEVQARRSLLVSRQHRTEDTVIEVRGVAVGGAAPILIAGPCSVESEEQMERIASCLAGLGVRFLRGGAFKPRTSPYSFQGLGLEGLEILQRVARRHGMAVVTEVLDPRHLESVAGCADILQIGTRNTYNYELLKEVGRSRIPVLLKRGFMATLEEFLNSAEYIVSQGNDRVILCERGVRTFERWTRNTLDISAVPLLKQESHLPVIVDVSHACGRRDILLPVARASLAAGAHGLMVEVHDNPAVALSDNEQQMDLPTFTRFLEGLGLPAAPRGEPALD